MVAVDANPSSDWTQEERILVAAAISLQAAKAAQERGIGVVGTPWILDVLDRINFVLTMGPNFLEANRTQVLQGHPSFKP